MAAVWLFHRPSIPRRAIALSFAALAVPVLQTLLWPGPAAEAEPLVWLLALVPAFLLAYYRGWRGAATALAVGMVFFTGTHLTAVWLGLELASWPILFAVTVALVSSSLGAGALSEALHQHRSSAEQLALTDDLTGLWNRRRIRMVLEQAFDPQRGPKRPFALVMFDLDSFKAFNDLHGHAAGDQALRNFAATLRAATGPSDLSGRYGGEEFISVLWECDERGALAFVEQVRAALQLSQTEPPYLTTCAGIACFRPGMKSPNELLIAADTALYEAKRNGRDCVRIYAGAAA